MTYQYSFVKEKGPGTVHESERSYRRVRYRGRCSCGRTTHQTYSQPQMALNAIRSVHNKDIEGEEHHDSSRTTDA